MGGLGNNGKSTFLEILVTSNSIGDLLNRTRYIEKIMDYDIRSAAFDIEYDAANDEFTITTYGYGHCVGFSQHGANILASKYGYTYDQILNFYYPGAVIK